MNGSKSLIPVGRPLQLLLTRVTMPVNIFCISIAIIKLFEFFPSPKMSLFMQELLPNFLFLSYQQLRCLRPSQLVISTSNVIFGDLFKPGEARRWNEEVSFCVFVTPVECKSAEQKIFLSENKKRDPKFLFALYRSFVKQTARFLRAVKYLLRLLS